MGWAFYSINKIDMASQLFKELVEKDSTYVPEGYIASMMRSSYIDESWNFFNAVNQKLSSFKKACCYMHLNQLDSAFKYYEMAYKEKDVLMPFFQLEPQFDMIADDPRFIELLIKMNLTVD
jgi:tetratricopeptide (TPR) repeat protein